MNITPAQNKAVGELVELIASSFGKDRVIHSETAIAAAAWLSGSLLLRSFNRNLDSLPPGAVVLSEEANEKGSALVNILASFLSAAKLPLDQQKLGEQAGSTEEAQIGILDALSLTQERAIRIGEQSGLDLEQAAQAGAVATAFIVKECAPKIGAEKGFRIAVSGFVAGSKTVPPKAAVSQPGPSREKPWYKFW